MKIKRDVPRFIYALCVLLAMAFWFVFMRTRMDDLAKIVYVLFLPLTASPYIMWVIHKEGQEPEGYFKETYSGNIGLMWFVRIFMMTIISILGLFVALAIWAAIAFIASLFW